MVLDNPRRVYFGSRVLCNVADDAQCLGDEVIPHKVLRINRRLLNRDFRHLVRLYHTVHWFEGFPLRKVSWRDLVGKFRSMLNLKLETALRRLYPRKRM